MKRENGMGMLAIFFIIVLIILLAVGGYFFIKNMAKEKKVEDIEANMLLIQGKCKVIGETSKVNNTTKGEETQVELKGKKLSEMSEDNIISEFLNKGLIPEDKLDKYYALSNEDLSEMGLDIQNEENSYYIVNYEDNKVYITGGYVNSETNEIVYNIE